MVLCRAKSERRALIVWGGWDGHEPEIVAPASPTSWRKNLRPSLCVYRDMGCRWGVLISLLFACECGQAEVIQARRAEQAQQTVTALQYEETVDPSIDQDKEVQWVTFLIRNLFERKPAQPEDMGGRSGPYEIALLLEIAQHSEQVLFKAVEEFWKRFEFYKTEYGDTLWLIEKLKINVPHYATPGWGPRMLPLSIADGLIVFESVWPGARSGPPSLPFSVLETEEPNLTWYEMERREFGERDLSKFASQRMSLETRAKLWFTFQRGKTPVMTS